MEINYDFLKQFSEKAEEILSSSEEMPRCSILVFSPVKVRKGTKNNPSPFYDREMVTENENGRYTLYQLKRYYFKFGDKYEPITENKETEEEAKEKVITRIKPDPACRMLYQHLTTNTLTVDVVNPEKVGETIYYIKTPDSQLGCVYTPIQRESALMESVNEWKPTHKGEYKPVQYQQFSLQTVVSLTIHNGDKCEEYTNAAYLENNLKEVITNI